MAIYENDQISRSHTNREGLALARKQCFSAASRLLLARTLRDSR
jgi:hypothetical protein